MTVSFVCVNTQNNIMVQTSGILPEMYPFYNVISLLSTVLVIFSKGEGEQNEMWKCATIEEDPVDVVVIWTGLVNVKNGTASDEIIKEEMKLIGQYVGVVNFV